jgi:hypothetical protein
MREGDPASAVNTADERVVFAETLPSERKDHRCDHLHRLDAEA